MTPVKKKRIFWWLHPGWTLGLATIPFCVAAAWISDDVYVSIWRTEKFFSSSELVGSVFLIILFAAGTRIQTAFFPTRPAHIGTDLKSAYPLIRFFFVISTLLTLIGYLILAYSAHRNGVGFSTLMGILKGQQGVFYEAKALSETIPGLSTATQFGMAMCILGTCLLIIRKDMIVLGLLLLVVFFAFVRGLIRSERLAVIELLIPVILIVLYHIPFKTKSLRLQALWEKGLSQFPLWAGCFIYLFFTGSEYFRSWSSAYSQSGDSLLSFGFYRLCGYYVTALNNGVLLLEETRGIVFPFFSLQWLWKFPGLDTLWEKYRLINLPSSVELLMQHQEANPEFNNLSGIFAYVSDFGWIITGILSVLSGFFCMALYRSFIYRNLFGLLLYPVFYIGFLEMTRIHYLTTTRAFPSLFFLTGTLFLLGLAKSKETKVRPENGKTS
jgi:hypothetical protein